MVRNAYGSGSDLSLKSSRTIRGPVLRQIRDLTGFSVAVLIWFGIWSVPVYVLLLCSLVFETNTGANSLSKAIAQENYARGLSKHLSELCVGIENTHECFQAIERHQFERGINGVTRKDSKLIISIRSGASTVLVDSKENETEGQWFNYVEYLSAIKFHLVHVQYYEGDAFLLVNSKS